MKKFLILAVLFLICINLAVVSASEDVTIEANDTVKYFNYEESFQVNLMDSSGNPVNSGNLTFYNLFDKNYTVNVVNGTATIEDVLINKTGNFKVDVFYAGDLNYNPASASFNVIVPVFDIFLVEEGFKVTRYGNTVYFSGMLFELNTGDEDEVIHGDLTYFIDGKEIGTSKVDYNGNFVFIWEPSEDVVNKSFDFSLSYFDKLGNYNNYTFNKTIYFAPNLDTHISAEVKQFEDYVLIEGSVLDENNNPVCGGNVEINFNNNVYLIPVDTYGNFKLYISDKKSKVSYEVSYFDWSSKADITQNEPLMNYLIHTELTDQIIELCKKGTPYVKFGNGNGPTIILTAGIHGNELTSQAATFRLINNLADFSQEIDGTIYIFPVLFPEATADNTKMYNGVNLNTIAHINGTISNNVVKFALAQNAIAIGDFHSNRHANSDSNGNCIFCSLRPTYESYEIAEFINKSTGYPMDIYEIAGDGYPGALEDYSNIMGIPSVTCEALSNHKNIEYGSPEISYNEMLNFLKFYGFDIENIYQIPTPKAIGSYDLGIVYLNSYNYNTSNLTLEKVVVVNESGNKTPENPINNNSISMESTGNPILVLLLVLSVLGLNSLRRKF